MVTAIMPYAAVCIMVFRRARAASYYLVRRHTAAAYRVPPAQFDARVVE